PGAVGDDAHLEPVGGIGAAIEILDEDLAALEIGGEPPRHELELFLAHRPVDVAPPDIGFAAGFLDDVLVLGRPAGEGAGAGDEGAAGRDQPLMPTHRLLVEHRDREIPMCGGEVAKPQPLESVAAGGSGDGVRCILHGVFLLGPCFFALFRGLPSLMRSGNRPPASRCSWPPGGLRQGTPMLAPSFPPPDAFSPWPSLLARVRPAL